MTCSNPQRTSVSALALVCAMVVVSPVLAETVTLTFDGEITQVVAPPPFPFEGVAVGDPWALSYTFDSSTADIDLSTTAGNYPDAVALAVLVMNFAAPFIDHYTQPRTYGHAKTGGEQ